MTMDAMVKYLENKGIEVAKKYITEVKQYRFEVTKGNLKLVRMFPYPETSDVARRDQLQREFLKEIVEDFEKEELLFGDKFHIKPLVHAASEIAAKREMDEFWKAYSEKDVANTWQLFWRANSVGLPGIKDVIFNDPATIILWEDGTKSVVKATDEKYDPEKGMAMAIARKALGNKGNYYNVIEKWLKKHEEELKNAKA